MHRLAKRASQRQAVRAIALADSEHPPRRRGRLVALCCLDAHHTNGAHKRTSLSLLYRGFSALLGFFQSLRNSIFDFKYYLKSPHLELCYQCPPPVLRRRVYCQITLECPINNSYSDFIWVPAFGPFGTQPALRDLLSRRGSRREYQTKSGLVYIRPSSYTPTTTSYLDSPDAKTH